MDISILNCIQITGQFEDDKKQDNSLTEQGITNWIRDTVVPRFIYD